MEQGENLNKDMQQQPRALDVLAHPGVKNRQESADSAEMVREMIAVRPDGSVVVEDTAQQDKQAAPGRGSAAILRHDSLISVDEFYSTESPLCGSRSPSDRPISGGLCADGAGAFKVSDLVGDAPRGRSASQDAAKRKARVITAPRMGHAFMQHVQRLSLDVTESFLHQVGGSRVIFRGDPGTVCKPVSDREAWFYENVAKLECMSGFTPAYHGVRCLCKGDGEVHTDSHGVMLEDLTSGYERPCVLDVKMGVCTAAPDRTEEKRTRCEDKDKVTTTGSIGARVCGLRAYKVKCVHSKRRIHCAECISEVLWWGGVVGWEEGEEGETGDRGGWDNGSDRRNDRDRDRGRDRNRDGHAHARPCARGILYGSLSLTRARSLCVSVALALPHTHRTETLVGKRLRASRQALGQETQIR
jgi:hypothetical protein